ncbi:hypothetical protein [Dolichospermum phage Dfl-JY45]
MNATQALQFPDWQRENTRRYASHDAELLSYLQDQLRAEGAPLIGAHLNHPVLGWLSYMSESNTRMQELLFAYLAIVVSGDSGPAKKLIEGQQLKGGLHPDHIAAARVGACGHSRASVMNRG